MLTALCHCLFQGATCKASDCLGAWPKNQHVSLHCNIREAYQDVSIECREYSSAYVNDEERAKKEHKGIWQGDFQVPAEWRKEKRERAKADKAVKTSSPDTNSSKPYSPCFHTAALVW